MTSSCYCLLLVSVICDFLMLLPFVSKQLIIFMFVVFTIEYIIFRLFYLHRFSSYFLFPFWPFFALLPFSCFCRSLPSRLSETGNYDMIRFKLVDLSSLFQMLLCTQFSWKAKIHSEYHSHLSVFSNPKSHFASKIVNNFNL